MTTNYNPLVKVILTHPFFDGDCPVVEVIPTNTTQRIMNSLMIRSVKRKSGIELFSGSHNEQPTGLETIAADEHVCLSFILRSTAPLFMNYTDLNKSVEESGTTNEVDSLQKIAYLTNLNEKGFAINAGTRHELFDPLAQLAYPADHKVDPESIALMDNSGNLLDSSLIEQEDKLLVVRTDDEGNTNVQLKLNELPANSYQILMKNMEGQSLATNFITSHDGIKTGDLCLLSLYFNKGGGSREDVTVSFSGRATYWRYLIISSQETYDNYTISDQAGNDMPFKLAEQEKQLPNGSSAKVITSTTPLFLQKRYPNNYQLNLIKNRDGRELKSSFQLPSADANRINYETITDTEGTEKHLLFSDIFIYL